MVTHAQRNNLLKLKSNKMKAKFLIGLAAAAITFGSLFALLGPPHCNSHRSHCSVEQKCNDGARHNKLDKSERNTSHANKQF